MGLIPGSDTGQERLTIEAYETIDCTGSAVSTFIAQSNPEKLSYTFKIDTGGGGGGTDGGADALGSTESSVGASAAPPVFKGYTEMTLDFDIIADATGIVPVPTGMEDYFGTDKAPSIRKYLDLLQKTVYSYQEKTHGPPYLKLIWGKVFPNSNTKAEDSPPAIYKGMIESYTVEIILFSLTGEPIKATIKLVIKSLIAPDAKPLGQSPDLTHHIPIKYGDKMSKHCNDIYGRFDTRVCSAVAEYNNMIDWELQDRVGKILTFPSIHILNDLYIKKREDLAKQEKIKKAGHQETHYEFMEDLVGEKKAKQYFKNHPYDPNQPFEEWRTTQKNTTGIL